jgi:purine-nucleoside phosphorylase
MNLPQWLLSKPVRDYVIILEGAEPGNRTHSLLKKHDLASRFVFSNRSLANGNDPRDVVAPVIEAYSNNMPGCLVIAPVWGTLDETFDWFRVTDHVNLSGENPLRGGPLSEGKPWFTPMGDAYSCDAEAELGQQLGENGIVLTGVLAGLSGPTHPTAAERKVLAAWGCAAYSWHIFTSAIAAAHLGMPFVAIGWNGNHEISLRKLLHLSA